MAKVARRRLDIPQKMFDFENFYYILKTQI